MRQTNWTLESIVKELNSSIPRPPRCFLINEIGGIFEDKEGKAAEAESFLRELLNSVNPEDRIISYSYLSTNTVSAETLSALKEFKDNQQNQQIIKKAEIIIRHSRSRLN